MVPLFLGSWVTDVVAAGGADACTKACHLTINSGPGGDADTAECVPRCRGIIAKLGVQPCAVFELWVRSVVISLMMSSPARVIDIIAALKMSNHATHMATSDAAVVEAEVGQLVGPIIPHGT